MQDLHQYHPSRLRRSRKAFNNTPQSSSAQCCAGTEAALRGCVNDAMAIEKMLVTHYGFDRTNITMLVDTDKSKPQPTGANIKKTLKQLVQASKAGDVLVFHYSGHGTQARFALTDVAACPVLC
jgi:Caspase domain